MRKLISISLLFALSFECFSNIYVWAGYELNKSYISSVLCVNRDNPAMHCDGKCFLDKQLKQNQQRQDKDNGTLGNKIDVLLFCSDEMPVLFPGLYSKTFLFPKETLNNYSSPSFDIFHPPVA